MTLQSLKTRLASRKKCPDGFRDPAYAKHWPLVREAVIDEGLEARAVIREIVEAYPEDFSGRKISTIENNFYYHLAEARKKIGNA